MWYAVHESKKEAFEMAGKMTPAEVIGLVMESKGMTNATVGKRIGLTSASMWDRLNNKKKVSMKVGTLVQMLSAMDYKVIAVPNDRSLREGEYELK
jgi:predicted XRE-type DNA-binding protein